MRVAGLICLVRSGDRGWCNAVRAWDDVHAHLCAVLGSSVGLGHKGLSVWGVCCAHAGVSAAQVGSLSSCGWVGVHACAGVLCELVFCWCWCVGVCAKQHGKCDAVLVPVHNVAPADVGHRTTTSRPAWPFEPTAHTHTHSVCCQHSAVLATVQYLLVYHQTGGLSIGAGARFCSGAEQQKRRDPLLLRDRAATAAAASLALEPGRQQILHRLQPAIPVGGCDI
jgi:hypothetical protein